ncbi:MAG: hypothetical protein PHG66_03845 [Candidatus Colwellbacteria bacterium]|nr:hypothetical protein [Candidatus Colwellbacteria bacterium]
MKKGDHTVLSLVITAGALGFLICLSFFVSGDTSLLIAASLIIAVAGILGAVIAHIKTVNGLRSSSRSRSLDLVVYIANISSEQLVKKNGSYLDDEKRKFWPISMRYNPTGINFFVCRKDGSPAEKEAQVLKVMVNISEVMASSTTFSLGIDTGKSKSYFSLSDLDKFIAELLKDLSAYQLPKS